MQLLENYFFFAVRQLLGKESTVVKYKYAVKYSRWALTILRDWISEQIAHVPKSHLLSFDLPNIIYSNSIDGLQ